MPLPSGRCARKRHTRAMAMARPLVLRVRAIADERDVLISSVSRCGLSDAKDIPWAYSTSHKCPVPVFNSPVSA